MSGTSATLTIASITENTTNAYGNSTSSIPTTTLFSPITSTDVVRVYGSIHLQFTLSSGSTTGSTFIGCVRTPGNFTSGLGFYVLYSGGSGTPGFYIGSNLATMNYPGITLSVTGASSGSGTIEMIFDNFVMPNNTVFQISDTRAASGGSGSLLNYYNLNFITTSTK